MQEKRAFYSRPDVSDRYDDQRFGGPSGERVHTREIALVTELLGSSGYTGAGRILDLACGTGRLTRVLIEQGRDVVAIDASPPMAVKTATFGGPTVLGDAFALPFLEHAFDTVVALRLAFHFQQLDSLQGEMARVISPGGTLIFDTYTWSPRALWALGATSWGGRVYLHRKGDVEQAASGLGLQIQQVRPCFLFSP
ncbi:MAG TPA: class I SAM-dependent methyltransferase, partial [Chloroflexota bacterium]